MCRLGTSMREASEPPAVFLTPDHLFHRDVEADEQRCGHPLIPQGRGTLSGGGAGVGSGSSGAGAGLA